MMNGKNKENFIAWFDTQNIGISRDSFVSDFERVSIYACAHGVTKLLFWDIDDFRIFNGIRAKLSSLKLFKLMHKQQFVFFEKYGKF